VSTKDLSTKALNTEAWSAKDLPAKDLNTKAPNANPLGAIQAQVQRYLDFAYAGGDELPDCFLDDCQMHFSDGSEYLRLPVAILAGSESESPQAKGAARDEQFVFIDRAASDLACAKVRYAEAPHYFTDHMTLLYSHNSWRIVSKLWADASDYRQSISFDVADQHTQLRGLQDTIRGFLDGLYTGDVEQCAAAFSTNAEVFTLTSDGRIYAQPAARFFQEVLNEQKSPKQRGEKRREFIEQIDMSSLYTAAVKLNWANPPQYLCGYLLMIALGNDWQIVSLTIQ
jgi:hypothetical protein